MEKYLKQKLGLRLTNEATNNYQTRYEAHQAKKKNQLAFGDGDLQYKKYTKREQNTVQTVLDNRRSQRVFNTQPITEKELTDILSQANKAPSSCNRHGINITIIRERHDKEFLNGILVGGVGWVYRADTILLFIADPKAYASPNEKDFMHYCDVGFTAMPMWYKAESLNIGASYINPNIREDFKKYFYDRYGDGIFVGALALGKYDRKAKEAVHPS